MKLTRILTITVALLAIGLPTSSFAKKPKGEAKAGKGDPAKKAAHQASAAALNLYDKDSSGTINGDETAAVRTAFAADKTGPLKPLDVSGDGTLDDNEIAAIKKGKGHGKGKKGEAKKGKGEGKKKKKNAV
jgi:hypothetical protein